MAADRDLRTLTATAVRSPARLLLPTHRSPKFALAEARQVELRPRAAAPNWKLLGTCTSTVGAHN
jgi:hypothetical protein